MQRFRIDCLCGESHLLLSDLRSPILTKAYLRHVGKCPELRYSWSHVLTSLQIQQAAAEGTFILLELPPSIELTIHVGGKRYNS